MFYIAQRLHAEIQLQFSVFHLLGEKLKPPCKKNVVSSMDGLSHSIGQLKTSELESELWLSQT